MMPHRLSIVLVLPFSLAVMGCGVETYQSRVIHNTIPFFQYHQELNANLGPRWRKGEVSLRLPAGLKEIPGPKKNEKEARDKRIPSGLNIEELTGLLGGFRGEVEAVNSAGSTVQTPFYALVLSNRVLLASRDTKAKPDKFDTVLVNRLAEALGGTELRSTPRHVVGGQDFAPSLAYEVARLDAASSNPAMRYEVYLHRQGPLQVAIVFVVPQEAARSERLNERIELSLQTLRLGGGEQAAGASSSGGGSPSF
ncbi:MAG: hypothetical protein WBC44_09755 [Planctomycetaceae bacterium]